MNRLRSFLAFSLVVAFVSSYSPSPAAAARRYPAPKGADLGVMINAPATISPGERDVKVVIRFTNDGPADVQKMQAYAMAADGISISDNASSALPKECKLFGKSYVLCNFQAMPKGAVRELSLLASVTGNADCRKPSSFRGSISGGINAIGVRDPNPKNNFHRTQPKLQCVPVCGNGVAETGEECDDGNTNDADACTNACKTAVCGDSIVQPVIGEDCDDGNGVPNDGCTKCVADFCEDSDATAEFPGGIGNFGIKGTMRGTGGGGGIYTGTDSCIDANNLMEHGCIGTKTNVTNTTCANGCKDGACIQSVCGNGTVEIGEQCDDGNTVNNDGCSSECAREMPDLVINTDSVPQTHSPDAHDVVMVNVNFQTVGGDIAVNEMYVLIQGQKSDGRTLGCGGSSRDAVAENIEDVEIRNTVTGRTIDAVLVFSDPGTKSPACAATNREISSTAIYRLDDFVLTGTSRWELRLDFVPEAVQSGDRFHAFLCTASETSSIGCDFSFFTQGYPAYNLDAEYVMTGEQVTYIQPGHTVQGHDQVIGDAASLSIIERSIGLSDTVVGNAQDITLFRFEATAGKAEDVFMTKLVLKADAGQLANANDYTLWVDTDDDGTVDTILESGRSVQNDRVTFSSFVGGGYTIPAEKTVLFEVHADIVGMVISPTLAIGFADDAAQSDPQFITAEEADDGTSLTGVCVDKVRGVCSGNQISLTTLTSAVFTIVSAGNLYITQSPIPARSRQLLAGSLGESVLDLRLRAEHEPIDVTFLAFVQGGQGAPMESIEQLKLFRSGETTPFASATHGACSAGNGYNVFCVRMFSQQLVVPDGDTVKVLVRPQMKSNSQGAINGQNVQLQLIDLTGNDDVLARGFASQNILAANDNDNAAEGEIFIGANAPSPNAPIVGSNNDVVFAKIAVIENVNPDADGTSVPTGTNKRIARFRFTAAVNNNTNNGRNKATLDGVIFTVTSANVDFDTAAFDLLNVNDPTQEVSCTWASASAETLLVECLRLNNPNVDLQMDSGESITLELQADIVNNRVNAAQRSSLQVSLTDFTSRSLTAFSTGGVGKSHIRWSDTLGEQSEAFFHWIEYPESMIRSTMYRI